MKTFRKGQSAMEYLMTYGWAIIIVIIVAAALVALGIFDVPQPEAATGFELGAPTAGSWNLDSAGTFNFSMTSSKAYDVNITSVAVTNAAGVACTSEKVNDVDPTGVGVSIAPGGVIKISADCSGLGLSSGSSYNLNVKITYDNLQGGFKGLTDSGKVSGPVSG